jgi:hypothetical protein
MIHPVERAIAFVGIVYIPGYTHSPRTGRRFKRRVLKKRYTRIGEALRKSERYALGHVGQWETGVWLGILRRYEAGDEDARVELLRRAGH